MSREAVAAAADLPAEQPQLLAWVVDSPCSVDGASLEHEFEVVVVAVASAVVSSAMRSVLQSIGGNGVVGPPVAALDLHQASVDELFHVVRKQRLVDAKQRESARTDRPRHRCAAAHRGCAPRTGSASAFAAAAIRSAARLESSPADGTQHSGSGGSDGEERKEVKSMVVVMSLPTSLAAPDGHTTADAIPTTSAGRPSGLRDLKYGSSRPALTYIT